MISPDSTEPPSTGEYRAYLALLLREVFIGTAETVPSTTRQDASSPKTSPHAWTYPASTTPKWTATLSPPKPQNARPHLHRRTRNSAGCPLQRSRSSDDLTYPIATGAPIPQGYGRRHPY